MRRYRRNEEFRLEPYVPEATRVAYEPETKGTAGQISGLVICGVVVNPKLKEPVLVTSDGEYMGIRSLGADDFLHRLGSGYHSTAHEKATEVTGYPRVHTPRGVELKGQGYGTSLYTGLCLGAYLQYWDVLNIRLAGRGQGISSAEEDRSREADRWWNAAVERDLASRTESDTEEEVEENIDVTGEVSAKDLNRVISVNEGEISYVNDVNVDVTKEIPGGIFDEYAYSTAWDRDLVVAETSIKIPGTALGADALEYLWRQIAKDGPVDTWHNSRRKFDADYPALMALDVRGLHVQAINLLSVLILAGKGEDEDVDQMRYRWENDLDPEAKQTQTRLKFNRNATRAFDKTLEARAQVGWDRLSDLP